MNSASKLKHTPARPRDTEQSQDSYLDIPRERLIALLPRVKKRRSARNSRSDELPPGREYELLYLSLHPDQDDPNKLQVASALHPEQRIKRIEVRDVPEWLVKEYFVGEEGVPEGLNTEGGREVSIVVSPTSGSGNGERIWEGVVRPLFEVFGYRAKRVWDMKEGGWVEKKLRQGERAYTLFITRSKEDIYTIAHELLPASEASHQTVVLLSGDTVISELLNALPVPRPPLSLAIIPTGTGNALSSTLHKRFSPLSTLLLGTPHVHPTFLASFSSAKTPWGETVPGPIRGAVVLSWGFHASLVADSDGKEYREKYGKERFAVAARENLEPEPHVYKGQIKVWDEGQGDGVIDGEGDVDGETGNKEHFYVLATLVSNLEKNLIISPNTPPPTPTNVPSKLYLIQIRPHTSPTRTMDLMRLAYAKGKHIEEEEVSDTPIKGMRIDFEEDDYIPGKGEEKIWGAGRYRRICIDGAIFEVEKGGWVKVEVEDDGVSVLWKE